jgi:ABC-2 type transport system ATP-binding protein
MIEVDHLSKSYGAHLAVDDVSFQVSQGEIVGFLGPNGAGKSTTLRILAGFLGATSGRVRIAGHDIAEEPLEVRASLGYMPETSPLYPEMRVSEYLRFRAELKLVPRRARRCVERACGTPASTTWRTRSSTLQGLPAASGSPTRWSQIAAAHPGRAHRRPRSGRIREVRARAPARARPDGAPVDAHPAQVEATCTRAIVIARGRLVAEGSIDEIRAMRRAAGVRVVVRGALAVALAAARGTPGVRTTEGEEAAGVTTMTVDFDAATDSGEAAEALAKALVGAGLGVREISPRAASLEQVFSELTSGPGRRGAAWARSGPCRTRPRARPPPQSPARRGWQEEGRQR